MPSRYEQQYCKILERLWKGCPVTEALGSKILAYFQSVLPHQDYPLFREHMQKLLGSVEEKGADHIG